MLVNNGKCKDKYLEIVKNAYSKAEKVLNLPEFLEVNVAFVSRRQIKKINHLHRNVNKVTDVLSFPTILPFDQVGMGLIVDQLKKESFPTDINFETGNIMLGDIYICLGKVKQQSKEYGHSFERELSYLAVHGLLHLLGYDHMIDSDKKIMREMEERILAEEI